MSPRHLPRGGLASIQKTCALPKATCCSSQKQWLKPTQTATVLSKMEPPPISERPSTLDRSLAGVLTLKGAHGKANCPHENQRNLTHPSAPHSA